MSRDLSSLKEQKDTIDGQEKNDALKEVAEDVFAKRGIVFDGLDIYKDAIIGFNEQIKELVQEGVIHEQTAIQLILENEIDFFRKIVQIKYHSE